MGGQGLTDPPPQGIRGGHPPPGTQGPQGQDPLPAGTPHQGPPQGTQGQGLPAPQGTTGTTAGTQGILGLVLIIGTGLALVPQDVPQVGTQGTVTGELPPNRP